MPIVPEKKEMSVTESSIEKYKEKYPWRVSDVLFTYLFIFALSVFAVGILLYIGINTESLGFAAFLQILVSASAFGIIYYIVSKKYHVSFIEKFGFYMNRLPMFLSQGIVVSFIIVISTTLISYIFSLLFGVPKGNPYVNVPQEKLKLISLLAIFIAPAIEEIFFRGFMQPAMIKSFGVFSGIFLTSIIFGLSHTQYFDYGVALIAVTTIGIILGVTRHMTDSVVPGIVAHLLNNLYAALSLINH